MYENALNETSGLQLFASVASSCHVFLRCILQTSVWSSDQFTLPQSRFSCQSRRHSGRLARTAQTSQPSVTRRVMLGYIPGHPHPHTALSGSNSELVVLWEPRWDELRGGGQQSTDTLLLRLSFKCLCFSSVFLFLITFFVQANIGTFYSLYLKKRLVPFVFRI